MASFCYTDVSPDADDFQSKAGGFLQVDRSRSDAPGKLAIWAWAGLSSDMSAGRSGKGGSRRPILVWERPLCLPAPSGHL